MPIIEERLMELYKGYLHINDVWVSADITFQQQFEVAEKLGGTSLSRRYDMPATEEFRSRVVGETQARPPKRERIVPNDPNPNEISRADRIREFQRQVWNKTHAMHGGTIGAPVGDPEKQEEITQSPLGEAIPEPLDAKLQTEFGPYNKKNDFWPGRKEYITIDNKPIEWKACR